MIKKKNKSQLQKQKEDEMLLLAQQILELENKARQELEQQYLVDKKSR